MITFKKYSISFLLGIIIGLIISLIIMSTVSLNYYEELKRVLNNNNQPLEYQYKGPIKNI